MSVVFWWISGDEGWKRGRSEVVCRFAELYYMDFSACSLNVQYL
jgi:hypothetical protein